MNWLNPANWVKAGIAAAADKAVDTNITVEKAKSLALDGVNKLIGLTETKVSDGDLRKTASGLKTAGAALTHLGEGIDPDGEGGRNLTLAELDAIKADIENAFGFLLDEEKVMSWRERAKAFIREKLGLV